MLALFNWSDEAMQVNAPIGETASVVFDVWEREYVGEATGEMPLEVRSHGCRLVSVREAETRPQVIGSTFHLLQGACEIEEELWDGEKLAVSLKPVAMKDGAIYVRVPNGKRVTVHGADDAVASITGEGICSIVFELREPRELTIAADEG